MNPRSLEHELITDPDTLPTPRARATALPCTVLSGKEMFRVMKAGLTGCEVYYIAFYVGGRLVGLVCVTELPIHTKGVRLRVAICGNPVVSCDCSIFTTELVDRVSVLPILLARLNIILRERGTHLTLLREMHGPKDVLNDAGYFRLPLEPVLGLKLTRWNSFDQYLDALRSHYRRLIRRAFRELDAAGISIHEESSTAGIADSLHHLFGLVATRAPRYSRDNNSFDANWIASRLTNLPRRFPHQIVTRDFFLALKQQLCSAVDITTFRKDGTIVASTINLADGSIFHSVYVAFDHDHPQRKFIYKALLATKLQHAFSRGLETIHFGRTGTRTKSDFGAVPLGEHCYVRVKWSGINGIVGRLANKIATSQTFEGRNVFKNMHTPTN